jgi:diadenosine tetraphosphate (Ap4A) HIT family hydrolase
MDTHADIASSKHGRAFPDGFPLSQGHTLVIPRRHVTSLFELPVEVQQDIWQLVSAVRQQIATTYGAIAFNVGLNDGVAAGQTVHHAHIHVIPRYHGDVEDPRGGVRWVIPTRAAYWAR